MHSKKKEDEFREEGLILMQEVKISEAIVK